MRASFTHENDHAQKGARVCKGSKFPAEKIKGEKVKWILEMRYTALDCPAHIGLQCSRKSHGLHRILIATVRKISLENTESQSQMAS